ncbi:MAG: hypothetical protein EOP87_24020, partial [Verrucomicrobiaceae bacterium]
MFRALGILALTSSLLGRSAGEVLTSAGELRALALPRLAEKLPVRISGVVTSVRGREYREFILQDGTGGLVASMN